MQIEINFNETYEAPIGSPRPRFRNTGRFVQTYMPTSYTKHKDFIREQMPNALLDGKLKVTLSFYFKVPKSWSNRKKLLAIGQYKRTKPDIDNLIKTVLDAANDHLWKDDNQIVEIHSFKQYAEEPKIILEVEEV
ncbi:RusA family crossover junction endodeoxyribonuclease [Staphylococcus haemolyticus]|uniref:RusA family crossover junction endodeoxyribonuclease n=1 Tax=Staphylococcus haemolyticus TaxID=1283 RepID=UPI000E3C8517|nr:RusA family crossover junction endodeoxyribonuclease [Staphylococcus haemolyticus]MDQ7226966.1 RusA family crossover junction endodeoxyribonuclease [Staphylococcus haemolyticus]RFT97524.1 RusA family crossover junction endodeoxyribonuclease [Staphylococcus haemolyticus]RFU02730.1 RusA family crossover junction endodeoxyribonuclease [Staphylococcus haemolyticus]